MINFLIDIDYKYDITIQKLKALDYNKNLTLMN